MADERLRLQADQAGRLDAVVAALAPELSRSRVAALIKQGAVTVDGLVVGRASAKVAPGAQIEVDVPPPVPDEAVPQDLPLVVVYEDASIVVVDKPAGMVVHPSHGHADGTLVNALLHHVGDLSGIGGVQRPGIVHRLDRGTSGLLVVAKGDAAHHRLAEQFATKTAGRTYLALVHGAPTSEAGTVTSMLARHPTDRLRFASTDGSHGKRAVTHWRVLGRAGTVSLLRCELETGRTHQIRVHLSEQGWPLVGDRVYRRRGAKLPATLRDLVDPEGNRPLLHAFRLRLDHPDTGARMTFEAPLPDDLRAALQAVGLEPGDLLGSV